jgi:4-carboxymuconolactone decarboxylase
MTATQQNLGGRLPLANPEILTAEQRQLFNTVLQTRVPWAEAAGFQVTTADGRLIGPFNAFLLQPEVAAKFLEFRTTATDHTTLSEREREIVTIAVGAVWGAEYELYAHTALARHAGLSDDDVATLLVGDTPDSLNVRERLAAAVARQLSAAHRIPEKLYLEAEKAFGAKGLFDIAALMGQYQTVCTLLTLFEVPAPN